MTDADVTVFVCVSCKAEESPSHRPGWAFLHMIKAMLDERPDCGVTAAPVECLSVCKRPCTIALAGDGKWTYVVGGLAADDHAGDVVAMAVNYRATHDGIVPWRQRPLSFRKGVVSRTPPLKFRSESLELPSDDPSNRSE